MTFAAHEPPKERKKEEKCEAFHVIKRRATWEQIMQFPDKHYFCEKHARRQQRIEMQTRIFSSWQRID